MIRYRRGAIKPHKHIAASLVIGTAVGLYFRSLICGAASFFAGVLMDIDHVFDGFLNYGPNLSLVKLYKYCEEVRFKWLTLVFHSYEVIILFWILIFAFSLGKIWVAIAIGATQHLIFDQITNASIYNINSNIYFFTIRLLNGFKRERFYNKT